MDGIGDFMDERKTFFITTDVPLKSGSQKTTEADRRILESANSGEGLIQITPEMLQDLAEKAQKLFHFFQEQFKDMPKEQASFIRKLRVEENGTWRYVAETCNNEWEGNWGSNQLAGMALCERAAILHGEEYTSDPWN